MTRFSRLIPIACLAALSQALLAQAQTTAPGGRAMPDGGPPPGTYEEVAGPPSTGPHQLPVFAVSDVEATQSGTLTVVHVHAVTTTASWRDAVLVPLVRGTPSDGILDLLMVAEPPPDAMPATGFARIEAVLLVQENHPYRGVRVRSATNVASIGKLPGKVQVAVPTQDCRACVGQAIGPAAANGEIARDTLPKDTRILGPADPFSDVQPNPNRLTLLIGEDGKVIEAMWQ